MKGVYHMGNIAEFGEKVNNAGRGFKAWFTDFTLVYSPIFIVLGLILTGVDLFLNLGISNSLAFKLPWSIAQLFAVDGLWFAIWNRILTDEYKKRLWYYHTFLIILGVSMTGIAIAMNYIVFTQDYMGLKDSVAAMNFVGIPVSLFLFVRSILLMATATLAIVLDKVMRSKHGTARKSSEPKPKSTPVPEPSVKVIPEDKPAVLALPSPSSKREAIKSTMEKFMAEGKAYTYKDIASETGASLQTVKVHAPKIRQELQGGK
jgi:hypothetical protein